MTSTGRIEPPIDDGARRATLASRPGVRCHCIRATHRDARLDLLIAEREIVVVAQGGSADPGRLQIAALFAPAVESTGSTTMTSSPTTIVGIAWLDEAQWLLLCGVVPDRSELHDSYEAWLEDALSVESAARERGLTVRRVAIDVPALCAWCEQRQRLPVGASRADFVNDQLRLLGG